MIDLAKYVPSNQESMVFLADLRGFLTDALEFLNETEPPLYACSYYYKYTDTLHPVDTVKYPDMFGDGWALLNLFHKLWHVDYAKRDMIMHCMNHGLTGKVGFDATFGIGGNIVLSPHLEEDFVSYTLTANGADLKISYGRKNICPVPGEWKEEDAVSIHVRKHSAKAFETT